MWRDPFLNFCFVVLLMMMFALQHSPGLFGSNRHGGGVADIDLPDSYPETFDAGLTGRSRAPVMFRRTATFFDNLWDRTVVVEEWWMDYTAWQWQRFDASSPAESDLVEARFHVATAEVFTDLMTKNARAIKELARAETSLNAARTSAGAKFALRLSTIRKEIAATETREENQEALSTAPFETIKADLDDLIAMLRSQPT
jgi:hypothetical protein